VPYENANNAIEAIKQFVDGKTLIDVMNALGSNMDLGIKCTTSAEETQKNFLKPM